MLDRGGGPDQILPLRQKNKQQRQRKRVVPHAFASANFDPKKEKNPIHEPTPSQVSAMKSRRPRIIAEDRPKTLQNDAVLIVLTQQAVQTLSERLGRDLDDMVF